VSSKQKSPVLEAQCFPEIDDLNAAQERTSPQSCFDTSSISLSARLRANTAWTTNPTGTDITANPSTTRRARLISSMVIPFCSRFQSTFPKSSSILRARLMRRQAANRMST
jgi:hypothetical protein